LVWVIGKIWDVVVHLTAPKLLIWKIKAPLSASLGLYSIGPRLLSLEMIV
jgi:hypothetical protein